MTGLGALVVFTPYLLQTLNDRAWPGLEQKSRLAVWKLT